MRSDARGYPWWPGVICSTQGPDTEAQDQSLPLCRFTLQRTADPYSWVIRVILSPFAGCLLIPLQRPNSRHPQTAAQGQFQTRAPHQRKAYSMTSSARARSEGGTVRPSALAVFRLINNSNFVGCSTGRSPGFAPLKILSTYSAARNSVANRFGP